MFSTPPMVEDAVTESALVVAEVTESDPPFTALKKPPMVEEPVTAKLVVVPFVKEKV